MKKIFKIAIYSILSIFSLLIILIIWMKTIYYYYLGIKPEYSELSKEEFNKVKQTIESSKEDFNSNANDYELLLKYIQDNYINWIWINSSGKLFINSKDTSYSNIEEILLDWEDIINKFNNLWIYQINNQWVLKWLFNNWIAFTKVEIRNERWRFRWYLYYEWEIPEIINKGNVETYIEKINDNWLIYDLKYFYE